MSKSILYSPDCVKCGSPILAPCEADQIDSILGVNLTSRAPTYREVWQAANVVKASIVRNQIHQRAPWKFMSGRQKLFRIEEIMRILVDNRILVPLSNREAHEELDELRSGTFCRVANRDILAEWARGADDAAVLESEPEEERPLRLRYPLAQAAG